MRIPVLALLFLSSSLAFGSTSDWTEEYWKSGCGRSKAEAKQDALRKAKAKAQELATRCTDDNGELSTNYEYGLCAPYDPNDLFCPADCPVFAEATCKINPLKAAWATAERSGNGNRYLEPGETHAVNVTLENLSRETIHGVHGNLKLPEETSGFVTVLDGTFDWGNLHAGQTATSSAEIQISSDAPCGKSFGLQTEILSSEGQSRVSESFTLGRFTGTPTKAEGSHVTLPNTLRFTVEDAEPESTIHKLSLSIDAQVRNAARSRFTLTAPNGASHRLSMESSSSGLSFDAELSEAFSESPAKGTWTLTGELWGWGNRGRIDEYVFQLVPREFSCAK